MPKSSDRALVGIAHAYLLVPILIFYWGWLRFTWASGCTVVLVVGLASAWRGRFGCAPLALGETSRRTWVSLAAVAATWVFASGIGGFVQQNSDFHFRNAVLHDLIERPWPVLYDFSGQSCPHRLSGHTGSLIYYFAFFLPSAVVGKVWGWRVANVSLFLYALLGVWLCFYLLCRSLKRVSLFPVIVFVLWSGMDLVGLAVTSAGPGPPHPQQLEAWAPYFQYSSHTTALFWVFNQAIPAWVATLLVVNASNGTSVLFTYSLCFLFAPLPCVGLLPFVVYRSLVVDQPLPFHRWLAGQTTLANLSGIATIAISGAFFMANKNALARQGWLWTVNPGESAAVLSSTVLCFCLLEFGFLALLLLRQFKREAVFDIAVLFLLLLPWYSAGLSNDLAMRASIPALVVLTVYTCRWFAENGRSTALAAPGGCLCFCLFLGSVTPAREFYRVIHETRISRSRVADELRTLSVLREGETLYIENFIASDPQESFFFTYMAKESGRGASPVLHQEGASR